MHTIAAAMYTYILEPMVNYMYTEREEEISQNMVNTPTHTQRFTEAGTLYQYSPLILARQC